MLNNQKKVEAVLAGDEAVIEELYKDVFPKVTAFIKKNSGDEDDAREVFQDALYQFLVRAKFNEVQINSSFEAYLFTICKNLWFKILNKRKRRVINDGDVALISEEEEHLLSILQQERWDLFEEKLLQLSENCRNLLKEYFKSVSYSSIVKKFSYATENAAFQRVFKCKKRLTELVRKDPRYKHLF